MFLLPKWWPGPLVSHSTGCFSSSQSLPSAWTLLEGGGDGPVRAERQGEGDVAEAGSWKHDHFWGSIQEEGTASTYSLCLGINSPS